MQMFDAKRAAETIWGLWKAGAVINELSPKYRPVTIEDGQIVQQFYAELSGSPIAGWKIAATSQGGQNHIGVNHPLEGPYLRSKTYESGATISMSGNHMRVAEAEFAFVFSRDLPAHEIDYEWKEIEQAVGELRPSLELPDSRFSDFATVGTPNLIADLACARECILGSPTDLDWKNKDLSEWPIQLLADDEVISEGTGADALGDPRQALTWLVNRLNSRGIGLKAGQFVTTGVCGKPMPIEHHYRELSSNLGEFGAVHVHLNQ